MKHIICGNYGSGKTTRILKTVLAYPGTVIWQDGQRDGFERLLTINPNTGIKHLFETDLQNVGAADLYIKDLTEFIKGGKYFITPDDKMGIKGLYPEWYWRKNGNLNDVLIVYDGDAWFLSSESTDMLWKLPERGADIIISTSYPPEILKRKGSLLDISAAIADGWEVYIPDVLESHMFKRLTLGSGKEAAKWLESI